MNKFRFECVDCGSIFTATEATYLCPVCGPKNTADQPPRGVLKTIYNYDEISAQLKGNELYHHLSSKRFIDILPLKSNDSRPQLKVGNTPLYNADSLDGQKLGSTLYLKDDSQNATFSFKDRASEIVSAYALEQGLNTIVAASTGNAGSSLAGICASNKQRAIIFVPAAAPKAKLTQIVMYGASIIPVNGTYDNAFDLSIEATKLFGWYNRNTAFNPFTIEGKKTVSLELYGQMGCTLPDRIFVPVGDGVIISGVYKGLEDLLKLGIISTMPVVVAVQAEGSDNIIRNYKSATFEVRPSHTVADSISVDIPRNFFMAASFLKKYNGETISVSDNEIITASGALSRNTGIFAEPAAACAFAGFLKYKTENRLPQGSKNMVLLTGSGLKDLNSVQPLISMPEAISPDAATLKATLEKLLDAK